MPITTYKTKIWLVLSGSLNCVSPFNFVPCGFSVNYCSLSPCMSDLCRRYGGRSCSLSYATGPELLQTTTSYWLLLKVKASLWLFPVCGPKTRVLGLTQMLFMPTETLVVVATETSPTEFLELLPDDGTASYFLPHLLMCSQRHLPAWTHTHTHILAINMCISLF